MSERPGDEVDLPTVSVCIPTLGRPSLADAALPSVLAQGEHLHEVVIALHGVDRSSLAPDFAADQRVRLVEQVGGNVGAVRNVAAAAATGDVLVFLDDDDQMAEGALAWFRRALADPAVGFASGAADVRNPDGSRNRLAPPTNLGGLYHDMVATFLAGTFAIRRALFERLGGYSEELQLGENFDLGVRVAAAVDGEGVRYRWTEDVVVVYTPSGRVYLEERAEAAEFTLRTYPERLAKLPKERATMHAIVGVCRWRTRDRALARRHFVDAVRASPRQPAHWLRLMVSAVQPIADRRWRP